MQTLQSMIMKLPLFYSSPVCNGPMPHKRGCCRRHTICLISVNLYRALLGVTLLSTAKQESNINYRPQTKLREGYVFTRVCDSVHRGGVYHTPPGQTPSLGRHPPGQTPPGRHTPGQTPPCPVYTRIHPHSLPSPCWDRPPAQCMLGYTPHSLPSLCWDRPPAQCMLGYTPHSLPSACWDTVNKLLYILANDVTKARVSRSEGSHWWLIASRKVHQVG